MRVPARIDDTVFHICTRAALVDARARGVYRARSLENEGFIHCSRRHQVLPTARAYFRDVPDLVVLAIDPARLSAPLVYEAPAPLAGAPSSGTARTDQLFPHCYGPIDLVAIVNVIELDRFNETT